MICSFTVASSRPQKMTFICSVEPLRLDDGSEHVSWAIGNGIADNDLKANSLAEARADCPAACATRHGQRAARPADKFVADPSQGAGHHPRTTTPASLADHLPLRLWAGA